MSDAVGAAKVSFVADGKRVEVDLAGGATIGRGDDCTIRSPASISGVSRRHADLQFEQGEWFLCDNNSTNGTTVNGTRITRQRVHAGDTLGFGGFELKFDALAREEAAEIDDDPPIKGSILFNMDDVQAMLAGTQGGGLAPAGSEMQMISLDYDHTTADPTGFGWAIDLFTEVGDALLANQDLDSILSSLLNLVFANVVAQRGAICLYDSETGKITPRTSRGAAPGRKLAISRTVLNQAIKTRSAVLVVDAGSDSRVDRAASVKALQLQSIMCVPMIHKQNIVGVIYVDTQHRVKTFDESHLRILASLAMFAAVAIEQSRLADSVAREKAIRNRLAKNLSPAVVNQMISRLGHAEGEQMMAEERDVTVLFSDLSGFTAMSENMAPTEVIQVLNTIFEEFLDAVFKFGGTLDKFMGDGMLAFFGAPLSYSDHAARAVRAALAMRESLEQFNIARPGSPRVSMRIGINSGPVVVGEIGSRRTQRNYTIIGDTVNTASRLESAVAKPGDIVINSTTAALLDLREFNLEALAETQVKGKKILLNPFRVTGHTSPITQSVDATAAE